MTQNNRKKLSDIHALPNFPGRVPDQTVLWDRVL